jgi:hypothetical protein
MNLGIHPYWIFFNNKSGESENIDVDVNDHRDENLDHYS